MSKYDQNFLISFGILVLVGVFGYLFYSNYTLQQSLAVIKASSPKLSQQINEAMNAGKNLTNEETAVVKLVKDVEKSVVSVVVKKEVFKQSEKWLDLGNGVRIMVPGDLKSGGKQIVGQGSGFLVNNDGLIVTNNHVVSNKNAEYEVAFSDGKSVSAKIVAMDQTNDLALLQIDKVAMPADAKSLNLGSTKDLQIGQTVIAIGNALGEYQNTVTKGVVSALNRSVSAVVPGSGSTEQLTKLVQTDAAINLGNSGGPLLTTDGQVIGINTAVNTNAQNIGFAIPVEQVQELLKNYKK